MSNVSGVMIRRPTRRPTAGTGDRRFVGRSIESPTASQTPRRGGPPSQVYENVDTDIPARPTSLARGWAAPPSNGPGRSAVAEADAGGQHGRGGPGGGPRPPRGGPRPPDAPPPAAPGPRPP